MAADRDWTQVRSRRCDECGLDAAAVAVDDLAGAVAAEGPRWRALLAGIDDGALRRRPSPPVWSALECACHVRGVLEVFAVRVDRALAEDRPDVGWWDHEAAVEAEGYNGQGPQEVAGALVGAADALAGRLAAVPGPGWERSLVRRGREGFTVAGLARFALHESAHHRQDALRSAAVREAVAEDAPAVAEVFLASRATLGFLPHLHTDDETRSWVAEEVVPALDVLVAEADGRVAGSIACSPGEVEHLYVHPDATGRGLGSALLAEAATRHPGPLELWCFADNGPARRFYGRRGFRVVGATDGDNEEGLPDVRYRRD